MKELCVLLNTKRKKRRKKLTRNQANIKKKCKGYSKNCKMLLKQLKLSRKKHYQHKMLDNN